MMLNVLLFALMTALLMADDNRLKLNRIVEDFSLRDYYGADHSLTDYRDQKLLVVAFLGTECPLARLYGPRLNDLHQQFASRGVAFLGVNSNRQDSLTEIAAYARRYKIEFPILKDTGNRLADAVDAVRTPEVIVLDGDRRVRYHGRIDNQYGVGYSRERATRHDLKEAVEELLAGKPVSTPSTEAVGCHIGRITRPQTDSEVTYTNQIARIFQKHCVECHQEGEIAPFQLTEYDEVVGWAETIAEVIEDQRMPPWHANPQYGRFANARLMSEQDKQLVYQWVQAGAPQGDPSNLPPANEYATLAKNKHANGFGLPREPDLVVPMRKQPFAVPAEGVVEYQYYVADPQFKEGKWVAAAGILPGNRAVVHHAIVFIRPPDSYRQSVPAGGFGWLTAYVPGQGVRPLPRGQAKFVPAGSKLVFQMHYTPTGTVQEDLTKVGLIFADPKTVQEEVVTIIAINRDFEIPAGAENHRVRLMLDRFPRGAKLLALGPHMHLRGKSYRVTAQKENSCEILLDVPHYDFNWQHAYLLKDPLTLEKGLRLECVAHFDNSTENLSNPDPQATVRWGDQTWEEMMLGFFEVAVPIKNGKPFHRQATTKLTAAQIAKAKSIVRRLMQRFDKNGDGLIRAKETPEAFAAFAFPRYDRNDDKSITEKEALTAAKNSLLRKSRGARNF